MGFLYETMVPAKSSIRPCRSPPSVVISVNGPLSGAKAVRISLLDRLRHTYATSLDENGGDIVTVQ
jgi:hypothetical protein